MGTDGILGNDSPAKLGCDANVGKAYMHSYSILIPLHPTLTGDEIRNHCTFIAKGTNVDPFLPAPMLSPRSISHSFFFTSYFDSFPSTAAFLSEYRCKYACIFDNLGAQTDNICTIFENNNRKGQMRRAHFSNLIATELASGLPACLHVQDRVCLESRACIFKTF